MVSALLIFPCPHYSTTLGTELEMLIGYYLWNLNDSVAEAIPSTCRPISNSGGMRPFEAQILAVDALVRTDPARQ